jgi:hypothetical protein
MSPTLAGFCGERSLVDAPHNHRAGLLSAPHCVHDHDEVRIEVNLQERHRFSHVGRIHSGQPESGDGSDDLSADGVVTTLRVADTHDQRPASPGHTRSTVRSRK